MSEWKTGLVIIGDYALDGGMKRRKVLGDHQPKRVGVNSEVLVSQTVAQRDDLAPGNVRVTAVQAVGQMVGSFTDGLEGVMADLAEGPIGVEIIRLAAFGGGQQVGDRCVDVGKTSACNSDHGLEHADGRLFNVMPQDRVEAGAGPKIHFGAKRLFQVVLDVEQFEQTDLLGGVEVDEDIHVR